MFWLLSRSLSPAPPRQIEMTTGAVDGALHQFALKYQALLKANGVALGLLPSNGSVQNLERLRSDTPAGFVQSVLNTQPKDGPTGEPDSETDDALRSLGVVG